jgi:hypothetical protein
MGAILLVEPFIALRQEACEKFKAKLAKLKQERSVLRAEKS